MAEPVHVIPKHKHDYGMDSKGFPALTVDAPCRITFQTDDTAYLRASKGESADEIGWHTFNAVTGPVVIKGAEPGDAIKIEILEIAIHRAWFCWENDEHACGLLAQFAERPDIHEVSIEDGHVVLSDRLRVPLQPMIGCIGLAPPEGRSSSMAPTFPWGGNMDLRELSPGATLWLPVQIAGANLYVGDLHACMGQGEGALVAIESSGAATVRVELVKGMGIPRPRIRVGHETMFAAMCQTRDKTHRDNRSTALLDAYRYLVNEKGLTLAEAFAYVCAKVDVRFGGPAGAVVLACVPDPEPYLSGSKSKSD